MRPGQLGGLLIILGTPLLLALGAVLWLETSAHNMRITDLGWDYTAALVWSLVLAIAIAVVPGLRRERVPLLLLWYARIGVTLGFMLFYESYYGLDASQYFVRGVAETDPLSRFEFGAGTFNIIGLASLHDRFIPDSYHAMKVSWAMLGLLSVYIFYRAACLFLGRRDVRVLYLLGLFPSILFWGSILGKDPITLFGISLYALGIVGFFAQRRASYLWILAAGILIASFIRIWLAAIFLLPLGVFLVVGRDSAVRRVVFLAVSVPALLLAMQSFSDEFEIETSDDLVERTDTLSQGWARGGSGQEIEGGFTSGADMIAFLPVGMFTALFRPVPGEILNPFGLLASAENALLLGLLFWTVRKGRWRRITREPLLAWSVATILTWSAIYGFISFQNLGSAFRFKVQVMPLLLLTLAYLAGSRLRARHRQAGAQLPGPQQPRTQVAPS